MSSTQQALTFFIQSLFQLYIFIILLRFMLQLSKADFYNPLSQFIVKVTTPFLGPLRNIIPNLYNIDFASIILAWSMQLIMMIVLILIQLIEFQSLPLTKIVIASLASIINQIMSIYLLTIIISALLNWFPSTSNQPIGLLIRQLVKPILNPFHQLLPNIGNMDISPIFAILTIQVIKILIKPWIFF